MECWQPAASFKIRGIGRLCQHYFAQQKTHFVASSGGNSGLAVAHAAAALGVKATVVIPETTLPFMRKKISDYGATLVVCGRVWDEADAMARQIVAESEVNAYIPPFDHPTIWQGHASIVDELDHDMVKRPDAIVLAVGGGGLYCGVVEGLQRGGYEDIRLIACEPTGAPTFTQAVKRHTANSLDPNEIHTICTSLATQRVAEQALVDYQRHPTTILTVPDEQAVLACRDFLNDHRVLVEPACGVALAPIYNDHPALKDCRSLVVIVCGGSVVQFESLQHELTKIS